MTTYEILLMLDPEAPEQRHEEILTRTRELVEKGGGTWVNAEKWDERRLAYQIKKRKRGLYIINHFTAPTEAVAKIDRQARITDLVLRHMITIDEDGLVLTPPVRTVEDEDFGGGFGGGGGERRFFGGGDR